MTAQPPFIGLPGAPFLWARSFRPYLTHERTMRLERAPSVARVERVEEPSALPRPAWPIKVVGWARSLAGKRGAWEEKLCSCGGNSGEGTGVVSCSLLAEPASGSCVESGAEAAAGVGCHHQNYGLEGRGKSLLSDKTLDVDGGACRSLVISCGEGRSVHLQRL